MTQQKETERATKALRFSVKDAEKGQVEAVFSTFNIKDHDSDWTLPEAFEDGAPVAISAYGHGSWKGAMPVGKGTIRVEKDRAVLEGQFFLNTQAGRETFEVVKSMGDIQEYSYGFDVVETGELTDDLRQKGVRRVLKRLKVYEVSPVLVGAGIGTGTVAVKEKADEDDAKKKQESEELSLKARQEFARFQKTRARLAS